MHKNNVGAIDCNVRSGADGDSDIGGSKSRGIVYSVADHCNFSFFFKTANRFFLSFRKNARNNFINADFSGNCVCGPFVVAGEHHSMNSHVFKAGNCFGAFLLNCIRNGDCSEEFSVSAEEKGCFSFFGKFFRGFFGFFGNGRGVFNEIKVSAENGNSAENSGDAASGKGIEIGNRVCRNFHFAAFFNNCFSKGVFAFCFKSKGNFKKSRFGNFLRRNDIGYGRGSFGDGSGFVENNDFGSSGFFKRSGGFIKNSVFSSDTASDHYRNRGCKTESAGAAYYEYGNSPCNCETDRFAKEEPSCRGYCRNGYYRRNKNSGNLIGGFRDGRFCCGSFLDHFYDFGKGGVFSDPCCFAFYKSALVKGCGGNERTDRFINGNAFAGEGGFVNGAFAFKNGSVNGNAFAGTNHKNFAFANFLNFN